ncbi:hypothetical protein [Corynebacterium sp. CCM 9203]|uniref:hypothetical protein n=1 Tax=Corynebacterium sp. CCM 9203 TaxID=3057615 RepID=UPI003524F879
MATTDRGLRARIIADLPLAVAGGVVTAMPDYIDHRLTRWSVDAAVLAAATVGTEALEPMVSAGSADTASAEPQPGTSRPANPKTPWPLLVTGTALLCAVVRLDHRITATLVGLLRSWGVARPHTVLGVCIVPILLASCALDDIVNESDGTTKQ